ncbi:MAG TPA: hypothetical protein VGO13_02560 [Solirubrobacterales bacterium]|jgi:capsular exopolysaccharide synthesis family protein|nr:hypothetical protein [Solirubrobacterales bacterium]
MDATPQGEGTYMTFFIGALRRRWLVVLACLLVTAGVALLISLQASKEYSAKAEVLFSETHYDQVLFGSSAPPAPDANRQAATNLKLVDLEAVSERTGRRLGISSGEVREAIAVAPQGESDLISVTATWSDADFAAELANTYVRQYIGLSRAAEQAQLRQAQRVVEAQVEAMSAFEREGADGELLESRANQLRVLAALQTGGAELASAAVPPGEPSSPNHKRDLLLGVALGLLFGIGLALLIDRLDRRPRTTDEIGEALRVPVLISVPLSRGAETDGSLDPASADVFRSLHANLRFLQGDRALRSVMFASLDSADGRSRAAWQLAAAAADGGSRALVIHADLRSPSAEPGLTNVIAGGAMLQEVVTRRTQVGAGGIDVLEAGPAAGSPMSLLATPRMTELLTLARESYEFVVVDAPPLGSVPDGIPLAKGVDGVVVVVRAGSHSKQSLRGLRTELDQLGVAVVGAVLTGSRSSIARYGPVEAPPLHPV